MLSVQDKIELTNAEEVELKSKNDSNVFYSHLNSLIVKVFSESYPLIIQIDQSSKSKSFIHKKFVSHRKINDYYPQLQVLIEKIHNLVITQLKTLKMEISLDVFEKEAAFCIPKSIFPDILTKIQQSVF